MIIEAILKLNPNAIVTVRGNNINTCEIEWHDGTPPIPKEQILAIIPQVELDIAMETLRAKRNKALVDSDWTILNDVPLNPAMRSAWMNYRTLLRNLTDNLTTVEDVKAVTLPIPPK
jgi:hypothetical protein